MPVTLGDDEFALFHLYLCREHQMVWNPDFIGETTNWASNSGIGYRRLVTKPSANLYLQERNWSHRRHPWATLPMASSLGQPAASG
jgi:hypothetical protein